MVEGRPIMREVWGHGFVLRSPILVVRGIIQRPASTQLAGTNLKITSPNIATVSAQASFRVLTSQRRAHERYTSPR